MPKATKRNFSNGGQAKAQYLVKIELVGELAPVSPSSLEAEGLGPAGVNYDD